MYKNKNKHPLTHHQFKKEIVKKTIEVLHVPLQNSTLFSFHVPEGHCYFIYSFTIYICISHGKITVLPVLILYDLNL